MVIKKRVIEHSGKGNRMNGHAAHLQKIVDRPERVQLIGKVLGRADICDKKSALLIGRRHLVKVQIEYPAAWRFDHVVGDVIQTAPMPYFVDVNSSVIVDRKTSGHFGRVRVRSEFPDKLDYGIVRNSTHELL